ALRRVRALFVRLDSLTSDNPEQRARLAAMAPKIAGKVDELERTVALEKSGKHVTAVRVVHGDAGKITMDALRAATATMQESERELLRRRDAESEASSRATLFSILLSALIGVGLVGLVFSFSRRALRLR